MSMTPTSKYESDRILPNNNKVGNQQVSMAGYKCIKIGEIN